MARLSGRLVLVRWHRRIGLVSAAFALVLAATGLLLNHSHDLGLDRMPLENPLLRQAYGVAPDPVAGSLRHVLENGAVLQAVAGRLRVGDQDLGACPQLVGIVEQGAQLLAVCSDRLWLLTPRGEVIDQADSVRGVPPGLSAVGQGQGQVLLRQGGQHFTVDLGDLSLRPAPAAPAAGITWTEPATPAASKADLDWEQVLLDVHSGRILGRFGVWLVDAMAIAFVVLALSGLAMAWRRRRG